MLTVLPACILAPNSYLRAQGRPQCTGYASAVVEDGTAGERSWFIVNSTQYVLEIALFDAQGHAMHIAPNMQFALSFAGGTVLPTSYSPPPPTPAAPGAGKKLDGKQQTAAQQVVTTTTSSPFVSVFGANIGLSTVTVRLERVVNNRTGQIFDLKPNALSATAAIRVASRVKVRTVRGRVC